jgi:hypothetical protein
MLGLARWWVREAGNAARAAAPGLQVVERVVVGEPAAVLIGESRHSREVVVAARGLDGPVADLLGVDCVASGGNLGSCGKGCATSGARQGRS